MEKALDFLHSWDTTKRANLVDVKVEDDIRDALQNVRTSQPSLTERMELLELSDKLGVQYSFLGFPASSRQEAELVSALIAHIGKQKLRIEPVLMARAMETDIQKNCRNSRQNITSCFRRYFHRYKCTKAQDRGLDILGNNRQNKKGLSFFCFT